MSPSFVSVNASCSREPFDSHANPIGGGASPLTRTLTHLVECGRRCPASTRWVYLRIEGLRLPVDGPGCQDLGYHD